MGLLPMKIDVGFENQPSADWKWAAVGQGKHGRMTYNYTPASGQPGDVGYTPADHNCVLETTKGETLERVQHKGMSFTTDAHGNRVLGNFVPWNSDMHDWEQRVIGGALVRYPANYLEGAEINYRWGDVQMFRAQWKQDMGEPSRSYVGTQFDNEHLLEWLPYDKGGFSPYAGTWLDVGGVGTNMLNGFTKYGRKAEVVWVWSPRPGDIYYITLVESWQRYENDNVGFQFLRENLHPQIPNSDVGNRKFEFTYTYVQHGQIMGNFTTVVDTGFGDSEPGFIFNGCKKTGVPYSMETIWMRDSYEKGIEVTAEKLVRQSELNWKNVIRFRHLTTALDGSRAIFGFFVNHTMGTRIFTTQLDKKNFAQEDMPFRLSAAIEFKLREKIVDGVVQKGELDFDFEILYTPRPATFTLHEYAYPSDNGQGDTIFHRTQRSGARYVDDSAWCEYEAPIEYKAGGEDYSRAPLIRYREILDITYSQIEDEKYKKYCFFAAYDAPEFNHARDQVGTVTFGAEIRLDGASGLADGSNDIIFATFDSMQSAERCTSALNGPLEYIAEAEPLQGGLCVGLTHARGHAMDDVFAYKLKYGGTADTVYPRESSHKVDFYRISNTVFAVFEDTSTEAEVNCRYTAYLYDGSELQVMDLHGLTTGEVHGDITHEHTYQFNEVDTAEPWKFPYLKKWWGSWNPHTREWSGFSSKPVVYV